MLKILVALAFSFNFLFAYFVVEDDYKRQIEVLKDLDIDATFLQDKVFVSMKEDISRYKQKQFLKTLEGGAQFIPILRTMIREADMPDAFLYMAMAESGFSTRAYSKARASGLWQFMSATAKKYGLIIDDYVDERRDPVKSTEAAIKYLTSLHDRFGKWYLAAMAYNCGEGRVANAIKKAGTDELYVLLDENKKFLPFETRSYMRKIVTMAYLSEDPNFLAANDADYFLNDGNLQNSFVKTEINGGSSLGYVADAIDMSLDELLTYNTHLNYFFTPPNKKTYHIYIPYEKQKEYKDNFDSSKSYFKFDVYIVAKGDTLSKIAQKYNINNKIIKDYNRINSEYLRIGQKLVIPKLQPLTQTNYMHKANLYAVKSGDTLYSISARHKTSVAQLKFANNLKDEKIYPGLKLEIPVLY